MKAKFLAAILLAISFACFASLPVSATYQNTTMSWNPTLAAYLTIDTNTTRCFSSTGSQTINALVTRQTQSGTYNPLNYYSGATVIATITKPDQGQSIVSFTDLGGGNYSKAYNFDQNGTYKIVLNASRSEDADANQTTYFYAGNFSLASYFTNNSQSYGQGDSASIRAQLNANDGNFVQGASAIVDINYPNANAYVSSQAMSEGSNGEYYYNFIVPSVAGMYSAAASFTCADKTDSNNFGRFSAFERSPGENPVPTPSTPNVSTLGGGGGGETAPAPIPKYDGKIILMDLSEPAGIEPKRISLRISNSGANGAYYLASVVIDTSAGQKSYEEFQETKLIMPGEAETIEFEKEWVPQEKGIYLLKAKLALSQRNLSEGKPVEFIGLDTKTETISILPVERPDVKLGVECLTRVIRPGDDAQIEIKVDNKASYSEQIALAWNITDPIKAKIEEDGISFEIPGKAGKTLPYVRTTNRDSALGPYVFGAILSFEGRTAEDYCTFIIQSGDAYYGTVVQVLKEDIARLEKQAQELKANNYNVAAAEKKISEINRRVRLLEAKVRAKDYALFEQQAQQLFSEVSASKSELGAAAESERTKAQQKPPEFPAQYLLYFVIILLVAAIAYFAAKHRPKFKLPKPPKREEKAPAPPRALTPEERFHRERPSEKGAARFGAEEKGLGKSNERLDKIRRILDRQKK